MMAQLPAIFRDAAPDSTSALRDLIGVLEVTTQKFDDKINTIGRQIDPNSANMDWLDRVAKWLDLPWHDALGSEAKRRIVQNAGDLLDHRGAGSGLARLLRCLLGPAVEFQILDTVATYQPMVLGSIAMPALLAGMPKGTPSLGAKAVLGASRLGCTLGAPDPIAILSPTIRLTIFAKARLAAGLAPLLPAILQSYIPAPLHLQIHWRDPALYPVISVDGTQLDGNGSGTLGRNSTLGRVVLGAADGPRFTSTGPATGFLLA